MDKNIKLNNLIKSLISSFKDYDNNLKNRLKVDSIILSFEESADRNLNKLINLSDSRYKYAKYGVNLENILDRQKIYYENMNNEIKKDKIYSSNILDLEKSKLLKSVLTLKNKEIFDIRDKLINSLRKSKNNLDKKKDIKSRKKNKIKSELKMPKLKIKISNNSNNASDSPFKRKMTDLSIKNEFSRRRQSITNINNSKSEGNRLIDNLMKEDYNNFFSTINSYHTFLEKLKNISNETSNRKGIKISKDNFEHIQSIINPNSLKFLTYKENHSHSKMQKNIKTEMEFDIQEIQKIKITHDKNNNNNILKKKLSNSCKNENKVPIFSSNKSISSIKNQNIEAIDFNKNYNYKNTANIVLNESEKGLCYTQNFNYKRKIFNNYFNKSFHNNNSINKKKINDNKYLKEIKNELLKKYLNSNKNEIYEYGQKRRENIKKDFQDIYEQKKLEWKNEEKLKQLKKRKEGLKRKEIDYFILTMKNKNIIQKE